jgi:hypothetical protein
MGPKKRAAENVDNGGGGTSQKKKKGEKEAEKANPADKAENTGKAKLAAKAPAEKIVIPKSELKTPSPPPSGRLFKVGARACATAPPSARRHPVKPPIRTPAAAAAACSRQNFPVAAARHRRGRTCGRRSSHGM